MKNLVLGLLAETSLHPGAEQSTGVIDMPVARESSTGYPVIVGSGLKGALRSAARLPEKAAINEEDVFGSSDGAGGVSITDARLLLLPVRSLTGHFKLITCPYILERLQRDLKLVGRESSFEVPCPNEETALVSKGEGTLFLEEISFQVEACNLEKIREAIKPLIKHNSVKNRLTDHLVIISDKEFSHFAQYGLQVNARNVLDKETKISQNLWYEETLPPDTLLYSLVISRLGKEDALEKIKRLLEKTHYLQVGGNETVGQGWCAVTITEGGGQ